MTRRDWLFFLGAFALSTTLTAIVVAFNNPWLLVPAMAVCATYGWVFGSA